MPAELRFRAMGSDAHVLVVGGRADLVDRARTRIEELERRWSRFRPDSELSRLRDRPGELALVSSDTCVLVDKAVIAWRLTNGSFDPTVLPAVRAAGYDADFAEVAAREPGPASGRHDAVPAPGCDGIEVYPEPSAVLLPAGVEIDPGGIGKGLAADLVSEELLAAGADGVMVNLGGDLRARGEGPDGGSWSIAVEHPVDRDRTILHLALEDGAVATSSRLRRAWRRDGRLLHHLIDPSTGEPSAGDVVAATVVAGTGWWAEAATKAVLVAGFPTSPLPGTLILAVHADGSTVSSPSLAELAA